MSVSLALMRQLGKHPQKPSLAAPAFELAFETEDVEGALQRALATLPDRQRQAVVLRHIEGLSNPEIAVILQTRVEAVESLIARGKRALAEAIAGQKNALGYEEAE